MNGKYLDELMEYFLSQGYPMAQLNVWQNHREIYHGCFGYADLENSFRLNGGYNYQNEIRSVFFGFGFSEDDLVRRLSEFSGGERTKIAFAKLLLSKPDLLLLDEITANLDAETELTVLHALSRAAANRTVLSISHRLYEEEGNREIRIS